MKSWMKTTICLGLAAVVRTPVPSEAPPPPRVYIITESGRTYQPAKARSQISESKTEKLKGEQPNQLIQPRQPGQKEKNK